MKIEKHVRVMVQIDDCRPIQVEETVQIPLIAEEVLAILLEAGDASDPVRGVIEASNACHQVFAKLPAESIALVNPHARKVIRDFFVAQAERFV